MTITSPLSTLDQIDGQPVRKSIKRLRWFISTFQDHLSAVAAGNGLEFKTDNRILTKCFLNWIRRFEHIKPDDPDHRLPFVGFISGQMLKELIEQEPVTVTALPDDFDESSPEYFWPEGYVYVTYCLAIRRAVIESDFESTFAPSPSIKDLSLWWTFKENVLEFSDYAVAYLDKFSGEEPDWTIPARFDGNERLTRIQSVAVKSIDNNQGTTR